jgi:hypothetical protein
MRLRPKIVLSVWLRHSKRKTINWLSDQFRSSAQVRWLAMKTTYFVGALLVVSCSMASSQEKSPGARSKLCDQASSAYEAAVRAKKADETERAKSRVLKECFPVKSRSPALQKPVSVSSTIKPIAPVRVAPSANTNVISPSPSVVSSCDAGGCWDNHGKRYNGSDATLVGPAGNLCIRSGDRIDCR